MEAGKIGNQPNFGQVGLSNHPAIVGLPDRDKLEKGGKSGQAVPDNHNMDGNHQESWATPRVGGQEKAETRIARGKDLGLLGQVQVAQWRTPGASDGEGGVMEIREGCAGKYKLRDHVAQWATPQASDYVEGRRTDLDSNQKCLGRDLKQWSTPRAGATDNSRPNNKGGIPLGDQAKREQWLSPAACDGEGGVKTLEATKDDPLAKFRLRDTVNHEISSTSKMKLNARWVETLMGLPVGWTMPSCANPVTIELMSCDCSETESYPKPVKKPSEP
jgi:hypothetical protein